MSAGSARELVAEALGKSAHDVPADGGMETVSGWDSLGHMRLILSLEERLSRPLTSQEIVAIRSVADVEALLAANAAGSASRA